MNYGEQITEQFQRKVLAEKLSLCSERQRGLFARLYPNGLTTKQLSWAITQVQNTLNKAGSSSQVKDEQPAEPEKKP